jgi:hypothetical protein
VASAGVSTPARTDSVALAVTVALGASPLSVEVVDFSEDGADQAGTATNIVASAARARACIHTSVDGRIDRFHHQCSDAPRGCVHFLITHRR